MQQSQVGVLLNVKIKDMRYKNGYIEKYGRMKFESLNPFYRQLCTSKWNAEGPPELSVIGQDRGIKQSTIVKNLKNKNPIIRRLLKDFNDLGVVSQFYITLKADGFCDRSLEKAIALFHSAQRDMPTPKPKSNKLFERYPDTFQDTSKDTIFLKYIQKDKELVLDERTNIAALAQKHKNIIASKSENTKLASNISKYKHKDHDNLKLTLNKLIEIVNLYQEELYLVLSWELTRAEFNAWKRMGFRNKSGRLIVGDDDNLIDEFAAHVHSNEHDAGSAINPAVEYFMQQAYLPIMEALKTKKNASWQQERYVRDIEHILLKYGQRETLDWLPMPPKEAKDDKAENDVEF